VFNEQLTQIACNFSADSGLEPFGVDGDQNRALAFCSSMICPDLPSPAEAGFAKAENPLSTFAITHRS